MRVLCLTPWFPDAPGKREGNYIFDSVMALRNADVEVKVLVFRAWKPWKHECINPALFAADLEVELHHYPSIPRNLCQAFNQQLGRLWTYRTVLKYARKHGVQLIHAHTEGMAEVAVSVARELGIGCVVTIHGINTAHRYLGTVAQRDYFRKVLNMCDQVILVGEPLRPFFSDLCRRDDHFQVIHNGFRLEGVMRNRSIFSSPVTELVSVSNLNVGKGIDLTLRALTRLTNEGWRDWHYTIVGDGRMHSELERLVVENRLGDRVSFAGAVEHAEVSSYLNRADIFVLPSYREAFGIAYLEAMACGLLVIGVAGQGAAEFIRHNKSGLLVQPRDVEDLAEKICFAITHIDESRRMAQAGRQTAENDFSWAEHAAKLSSLYKRMFTRQQGV